MDMTPTAEVRDGRIDCRDRVGRILLSFNALQGTAPLLDDELLLRIFSRLIVLEAEARPSLRSVEFVARSPDFRRVVDNESPPCYSAVITRLADGTTTFRFEERSEAPLRMAAPEGIEWGPASIPQPALTMEAFRQAVAAIPSDGDKREERKRVRVTQRHRMFTSYRFVLLSPEREFEPIAVSAVFSDPFTGHLHIGTAHDAARPLLAARLCELRSLEVWMLRVGEARRVPFTFKVLQSLPLDVDASSNNIALEWVVLQGVEYGHIADVPQAEWPEALAELVGR